MEYDDGCDGEELRYESRYWEERESWMGEDDDDYWDSRPDESPMREDGGGSSSDIRPDESPAREDGWNSWSNEVRVREQEDSWYGWSNESPMAEDGGDRWDVRPEESPTREGYWGSWPVELRAGEDSWAGKLPAARAHAAKRSSAPSATRVPPDLAGWGSMVLNTLNCVVCYLPLKPPIAPVQF